MRCGLECYSKVKKSKKWWLLKVKDPSDFYLQLTQTLLMSLFQKAHRGGVEVHGGGGESPSVRQDGKNHPQTCGGATGWDRASAVERWEDFFVL